MEEMFFNQSDVTIEPERAKITDETQNAATSENEQIKFGEQICIEEYLESKPIGVYVKVNEEGDITNINSDIFIKDFEGWLKLDEGHGDKFAHAQNQYFEKPLFNEDGTFTYNISSIKKG